MNNHLKFSNTIHTDGKGYWSGEKRAVKTYKIIVHPPENANSICYVEVYFTKHSWDVSKHGLIYTDKEWLKGLKYELFMSGFSKKVLSGLDYTEQGMQGDNFVSLDAYNNFYNEWHDIDETNTTL